MARNLRQAQQTDWQADFKELMEKDRSRGTVSRWDIGTLKAIVETCSEQVFTAVLEAIQLYEAGRSKGAKMPVRDKEKYSYAKFPLQQTRDVVRVSEEEALWTLTPFKKGISDLKEVETALAEKTRMSCHVLQNCYRWQGISAKHSKQTGKQI